MDSAFIKFLGSAGARVVVAKQLRSSAGVYIAAQGQNLILDPGPGTLVRCAKSRPPIDVTQLDALILTHAHLDHSNDVNILIDAMTAGGLKRRGTLFAPQECLEGDKAVVLSYLKSYLEKIIVLTPEQNYQIGELKFSTSLRHRHPVETYGIKFDFDGRPVAFLVDTGYFPGLLESYKDSWILIINVVRAYPHKSGEVMHLCLDEVRQILAAIRPRKAILTHFGMTMLKAKPWQVAQELTKELGIEVIAASDGLKLDIGGEG
ncbi:MAG: MBL fold metallo-hydrolase [Deltaproteobacteria bacterium]|nr:MBL fold metallo-hydrolase [Deltaproteobacteria bacterium]MBW1953693.1 MBL fold metallo-hydrolase [Deltaproteobacteria bacterium]MBW1987646.1 MBL fold metallo-hydrolase [Deltaproteobacteria bacterium]MBW2135721.1 MBL fold metallo-hydrolase [Deltaproteobacteria bacterium]